MKERRRYTRREFDVPVEILRYILDEVNLCSPKDLQTIGLVNRLFSDVARSYLFRSIILKTGNHKCDQKLKFLEDELTIRRNVREVHVINEMAHKKGLPPPELNTIMRVIQLGSKVVTGLYLKHFEWTTEETFDPSIESSIMDAFPTCRISIHLRNYDGGPLSFSDNLVSIHARIPLSRLNGKPLSHFESILVQYTNLRRLHIQNKSPSGNEISQPFHLQALPSEERIISGLEELTLGGQALFRDDMTFLSRICFRQLHTLILDPFFDAIFLTQLSSVSEGNGNVCNCFPALKRLRISLTSDHHSTIAAVGSILKALAAGLEELELLDVSQASAVIKAVADYHGGSLCRLKVHTPENWWAWWAKDAISDDEFRYLGKRCSALEELYLDVYRVQRPSGEFKSKLSLSAINESFEEDPTLFPKLSLLRISAPLGLRDELVMGPDDIAATEVIPEDILSSKPSLETILIEIGEQDRPELHIGTSYAELLKFEAAHRHVYMFSKAENGTVSMNRGSSLSKLEIKI